MRAPISPPRRPSAALRLILPTAIFLALFYYLLYVRPDQQISRSSSKSRPFHRDEVNRKSSNYDKSEWSRWPSSQTHPIDDLIKKANKDFDQMMAKESHTLEEAARAYRKRRGRHPPPGFDAWYMFAKSNDALFVEDFWDQIYDDLRPFWGLDPAVIRKEAWDFEMVIHIRNGHANTTSDWFWTQIWLDMIQSIEHLLPDMDLALNAMDEPRIIAPWEDMAGYVKKEQKSRVMKPVKEVRTMFSTLPEPGTQTKPMTRDKNWESNAPFWRMAIRGCPPDSPARASDVLGLGVFEGEPDIMNEYAAPHQYYGFVSNYTLSTQFCHQPDLQQLEGIFINPQTISNTQVLWPMFGGSKLATNNEILLPAPMYWRAEERFTGGGYQGPPWDQKYDGVMWRGVTTGGRNTIKNWKGFQRHRFVSMNNRTEIEHAENGQALGNFVLPSRAYQLATYQEGPGRLGEWVQSWSDVGATDLMCDASLPPSPEYGHCEYTGPYYDVQLGRTMAEQFNYKYLPDIDGNSFSGRYLGFLRSTSVPVKSTLWREWHDSRLVAWKHFVPMDSRFGDWYGIMEYFLGYGADKEGHDIEGKRIAMAGKEWADRVLRRQDMQIYTLRLLLEYARVTDDGRDNLGWVGDLTQDG